MKQKSNIQAELKLIPESVKRAGVFIKNPWIIPEQKVYIGLAYKEVVFLLGLVTVLFGIIRSLSLNYLEFPVFGVINPLGLGLSSIVQISVFSLICCFLVSLVLFRDARVFRLIIFVHYLRAFAVVSIPVSFIFIIGINRSIISGNIFEPINTFDFWFALSATICAIAMILRLMVLPLKVYLSRYFKGIAAIFLSIGLLMVAFEICRVFSVPYLSKILIDEKAFIAAVASFHNCKQ